MIRNVVILAALVVLAALALRLLVPRIVHRFIYFPQRTAEEEADPARWGLTTARELHLRAADGVPLHAWWVPRPTGVPDCGTALYLHGNAGSIVGRGGIGLGIARTGFDVLMLDYRGYGRSGGEPDEAGLYLDAVAAHRYIVEVSGLPARRILLFGESLGAAVAVELAAREPVGALVLAGPLPGTVLAARTLYPFIPDFLLDWERHRFDALSRIGRVEAPILFAHGTEDRTIPRSLARTLYEAAGESKRWYAATGFGHNDIYDDPGFWRAVARFARETMPCRES
ncbi:MAG TPA: alpha/beta hydrolase [Gemmatimonadota bacterium]|nr:alpha/beta hydrolase [Gemmatimonadota bacterium]